jgi:VWFA-related protein
MRPLLLAACGLLLAATPFLHAQDAPSPMGPPPASTAPVQEELPSGGETLRVRVNLVNTYFSARDKGGFLTGLHKDDCGLTENKEPQTIKNFTQEKSLPLTIGILLDTSGSQQNVLPLEQESGVTFLKDVLTSKDEAFLISFDINVDLLADFTSSTSELRRAMNKAQINTGAGTGSITGNVTPKGTLLYDAVYLATHEKLHDEAGRKVIVMLTDGGDQGSQVKLKEAIEAAQKSNTIVYVILISDSHFMGQYIGFSPTYDMDKLTGETGGRVINIGHDAKRLDAAFQQISDELRTQYLVSYTPKNPNFDGTFRNIAITCGKDVKVQARKGYYAVADSNTE